MSRGVEEYGGREVEIHPYSSLSFPPNRCDVMHGQLLSIEEMVQSHTKSHRTP